MVVIGMDKSSSLAESVSGRCLTDDLDLQIVRALQLHFHIWECMVLQDYVDASETQEFRHG